MGVVSIEEVFQRDGSIDEHWQRQYKRQFRVETDNPYIGWATIRQQFPIKPNDYYRVLDNSNAVVETDSFAFAHSIKGECTSDDGLQWMVTVEYAPYDVQLANENPLDNRPQVVWEFVPYQETVDVDINGNPVVNAAGDPFDPGLVRDQSRPVLKITRNEATFDPFLAWFYRDKSNSGVFMGAPAKGSKIASITTPGLAWNITIGLYYPVTYEFHFEPNLFTPAKILNAGYRKLSGGQLVPILQNGVPVSQPAMLTAAGDVLAAGGTPNFLSFEIYETVDFGVFNLDPYPGS